MAPRAAGAPNGAEVPAAIATTRVQQAPGAGLRLEYRLEGEIAGAELTMDDRLAHLMAFPGSVRVDRRT